MSTEQDIAEAAAHAACVRAAAITALLADAPKADDHDAMRKYLHALAELGCAVLFLRPGSKLPVDLRTKAQRDADNRIAQEQAREAGLKGWELAKSKAGVHLATTDTDRIDAYLDAYAKRFGATVVINVGVNLGASRLIVVDTDTPEQEQAFRVLAGLGDDSEPTVVTPGTQDTDTGQWSHHGGGHRYYTVPPETWLPEMGEMTLEGGAAAYWGSGRQIVLPPSVRPEGAYTVTEAAVVEPAPDWLLDRIVKGRGRKSRAGKAKAGKGQREPYSGTADDPITAWGQTITWAEILGQVPGWMPTGKTDSTCGCDTWTAPGVHADPKSATAHEAGCRFFADSLDPPMHFWTTDPGAPFEDYTDGATLTRLRAVALIHHDGDVSEAMTTLGIESSPVTFPDLSFAPEPTMTTAPTASADGQTYSDPATAPTVQDQADEAKAATARMRQVMTDNADLFDASEILSGLAAFADARHVGRWTLLGGVLVRVITALPHTVVLPGIIGSEVSLNLLMNQVGVYGSGKGGGDNAASEATVMKFRNTVPKLDLTPIGTGEGINRTYATAVPIPLTRRSETVFYNRTALFGVRDVTTLEKLKDRAGATIIGELLKAYMGEELGFANADKERRVILPRHSYRLGLIMGVQPSRAMTLLDVVAQGDGLPQRFLWLPVTDLRVRSGGRREGTPVRVSLPTELYLDPLTVDPPLVPLDVDTSISDAIIAAHNTKNLDVFGRSDDPLAGHRMLNQLKITAAFAAGHGSAALGGEYWEWAERLTDVSTATMNAVFAETRAAAAVVAEEQGRVDGHRRAAADDTIRIVMVRKTRDRVLAVLGQQPDWTASGTLSNAVSKPQRVHLPDALAGLLADGLIETDTYEYNGQVGIRYRITAR